MSTVVPGPENLPAMNAGETAAVDAERNARDTRLGYAFMTLAALGAEVAEFATKNDTLTEVILGGMATLTSMYWVGAQIRVEDARARRQEAQERQKARIGDDVRRAFFERQEPPY